jgi:methylase of polypeptide subunit release factors
MIQLADDRHFAVVREFLLASYAEDSGDIADRVGDFLPEKHHEEPPLIRMLFLGRAISPQEWEDAVPASVRESFHALGLIEPASNDRVRASCLLYRLRDVYVTSDRFMTDEGQVGRPAQDSVYYSLTETAQHYLWSLPTKQYERALEIGSGSGVAALLIAKNCEEMYATDIAPRCILYSEFNRRLNGFENIVVREGSFYEPVEGLQFDLIACHPPFDLSLSSNKYVYADGGADGEFVTREVIAGLGDALKPGGQYVSAFRASDRKGAPIETRIRQWLGERQDDFDIAVAVRSTVKPEEHAISASMLAKQNLDEYEKYMDFFKEIGITQFVYCHLLIERKTGAGTPITARRVVGERCTARELEGLLAWERSKDSVELVRAHLTVSEHTSLHVRHALKKGELVPVEYKFEVVQPFADEQTVPEWVAKLVALCVAGRTADAVHALMRKEYPIGRPDFDAAVKRLVGMGVLQLASGSKTMSSN